MSPPCTWSLDVQLLLDKLNGKGLVEATLSTCGEQVVTGDTLRAEIEKTVDGAGGRASSPYLAAAIGVDESVVKSALRQVYTQDSGARCVERGESYDFFTGAYLNALGHEAEETARKRGRITLKDLSSMFELPIHVMEDVISAWVFDPSYDIIRLASGALMTESYELGKRAALRAICKTATEPCSVEELMRGCDLCREEEEVALELLRDLTQCGGELQGSLTGVRTRQYVPDSFVDAQHEAAYDFFAANGYLDHATATKMQVRKLHAFVKEKYPRAECLETVVVSRDVVEQLDAVADEAVAQGSWFEAWAVVPSTLTETDAAQLVGKCAACQRPEEDPLGVLQLCGVYGVSTRFVEDIVNRFREDAASTASYSSLSSTGPESEMKLPRSNTSSRKGSGKSRRRNAGRKAEHEVAEEEVRSFVCQCKPELQNHPLLVAALGGHLRLPFREAKMEAIRRASEVSVGSFHKRVDAFESTFERKYLTFQLHYRGVQALRQARRRHSLPGRHRSPTRISLDSSLDSSDPGSAGTAGTTNTYASDTAVGAPDPDERAEAYLLETKGAELAEIVTARECEKLGIAFSSHDKADGRATERMPLITKEACSALAEVLPADVAGALASLWKIVMNGGQLSTFCDILEEQVFPASNLVGRRLDKRRERQFAAEGQQAMKESLFKAVSECEVLHFATLLVFHNATGGVPFLPQPVLQPHEGGGDREESWSRELLSAVRGDISAETEQSLVSLQREIEATPTVVTAITSNSSGGVHGESATASDGNTEATSALPRSHALDGSGALRIEAGDRAARLLRLIEAVRALGLACGD